MATRPPTASTDTGASPPGVRVAEVSRWLAEHVVDVSPPLQFDLVAGGRSNFTYRVIDAEGRSFVLRRPPLGPLLPSAHDMSREHKIIAALAGTAVPVAPALGFCDDPAVNERPFYVMGFVDGLVLRDRIAAAALPDPAARLRASESVADVLAELHDLDVDAVGLGDLGKRDGYIERQLRRWHGQFTQSKTREVPLVDEVFTRLSARIPHQQGVAVVHGDYRLDNCIVTGPADTAPGRVAAVLDWELCTLGDPLADLGLLAVYWPGAEIAAPPLGPAASQEPGFLHWRALVDRYQKRSARDLSDLGFYIAFGYWKLACILEGVYARYKGGSMGDDGYDFTVLEAQIPQLAEAAHEASTR